jgi:hypothetical protein
VTSFSDLDPTSPDDPRLDPHSDTARAANAAALVRGAEPAALRAPHRHRRAMRVVVAGGVAGTIALGAVLAGGRDGTPTDALAAAAANTAGVESGVVKLTSRSGGIDGYLGASQQVLRFSGDRLAGDVVTEEALPGDDRERREMAFVIDGNRQWTKQGDGQWERQEQPADGPTASQFFTSQVDNKVLGDLVTGADDARQDGDTWTATVTRQQLAGAGHLPFGLDEGLDADSFTLQLTLSDGLIRRVVITTADSVRTAEYEQLGEPQEIAVPAEG